jgi:hypothetical protein
MGIQVSDPITQGDWPFALSDWPFALWSPDDERFLNPTL